MAKEAPSAGHKADPSVKVSARASHVLQCMDAVDRWDLARFGFLDRYILLVRFFRYDRSKAIVWRGIHAERGDLFGSEDASKG